MGKSGSSLAALAILATSCRPPEVRTFSDRPVAWHENDDRPLKKTPAPNTWEKSDFTHTTKELITRPLDRTLSLESPLPAGDVNALDEVPCSTWYCPRNHMTPLSVAEITAGPPGATPPVLPLTVVAAKPHGATAGFEARDARGQHYMVKLDPAGYPGLYTGAERVAGRLMWAAGYNVPNAFLFEFADEDLHVDPDAYYLRGGFDKKPLLRSHVDAVLAKVARMQDGDVRAVAVPWIEGEVLGSFELIGRRKDDPNDRIPHEDRRSLRASYVLFSWLSVRDAGATNTLESVVQDGARRYVRHYFIDFGSALGSSTVVPKDPSHSSEYLVEPGRTLGAIVGLGFARREWQGKKAEWEEQMRLWPSIGWFPADGWDPQSFRPIRRNQAFDRMTARDAYWGAKLVTSFTDEQISAAVATGGYDPRTATELLRRLMMRRNAIAATWLRSMTAIENPDLDVDDTSVCFEDLAIARGAVTPAEVVHRWKVRDVGGRVLLEGARPARSATACVPIGKPDGKKDEPYRILALTSVVDGHDARTAYVHVRSRPSGGRVIVGVDRE